MNFKNCLSKRNKTKKGKITDKFLNELIANLTEFFFSTKNKTKTNNTLE